MAKELVAALVALVIAMTAITLLIGGGLHTSATPASSRSPVPPTPNHSRATPTPSPSPTPTPVPPPPPPPPPPPRPITVSGYGTLTTGPFPLSVSAYTVRYTLSGRCDYAGVLMSTDGSYNNRDFVADTGPTAGVKLLSKLPTGNYRVAMTTTPASGCGWSITFVPR